MYESLRDTFITVDTRKANQACRAVFYRVEIVFCKTRLAALGVSPVNHNYVAERRNDRALNLYKQMNKPSS